MPCIKIETLLAQLMRMESAHQRRPSGSSGSFTAVVTHHRADQDPQTTTTTGASSDGTATTTNKPVHNASSKVTLVVRKMLLPLLDTPMHTHVVFDAESDQEELDLLEQLDRSRPNILEDPKSFVQHLQSLLGRYQTYASGYSRVSTTSSAVVEVEAPTAGPPVSASLKEQRRHTTRETSPLDLC